MKKISNASCVQHKNCQAEQHENLEHENVRENGDSSNVKQYGSNTLAIEAMIDVVYTVQCTSYSMKCCCR